MQFALGVALLGLALAALPTSAQSTDPIAEIREIEKAWSVASHETPASERERVFEALSSRADALVRAHPERAEPLIWSGIVKSSWAGARGGMDALRLAKESRTALESAERIDGRALDGSVYTTLGMLYASVPRWPLGFGSRDKARAYFQRALEVSPTGGDANYFYGAFLADDGKLEEARLHLERARAAPLRPGHEEADRRRRKDIEERLARLPAR